MSTTLSVDDILAKFPTQKVQVIHGEPSYDSITSIKNELYANAAVIPTTLGGGQHGHIGLIMPAPLYATLSNTPFIFPADPGPLPQFSPNIQYTAVHRDTIIQEHKEQRHLYDTITNVDLALKKLVLAAIDDVYLNEKKHRYTGYLNISTLDLLTHLMQRYGKITPLAIKQNKTLMEEPLDTSQPIDVYFRRVDDCVQFAVDANSPFSAQQILETAYYAVIASGLYIDGCKAWRKRSPNTKSWLAFKTFFAGEYHDLREQIDMNAQQTGYHTANAVTAPVTASPNQITEALDNLAMATVNDRNIIAQLTQANAALTATNQKLVQQMAEAVQSLKVLMDNDVKREQDRIDRAKAYNERFDPNGYCWSHGYKVTCDHNSATCTAKKPGHKDNATRANTMGGCQLNKTWKHPSQL